MELHLFEQVGDVVRALLENPERVQLRVHRRGVKLWVGDTAKPPREHYEAQLLARRHVDQVEGMAIEIGFHAEHKDEADNQAAVDRITRRRGWIRSLGGDAEAAEFFGAPNWRRVSEAWVDPDLDDPDLAFEVGSRLVDFVEVLEPLRN